MTSSIHGITVTVLAMYIFLGTSVTFCRLQKSFAHVFGKRNDGLSQNNADTIRETQTWEPLLNKIRLYQKVAGHRDEGNRLADEDNRLAEDTFYNKNGGEVESATRLFDTYGNDRRNSVTLLDLISPVEKEYLAYLYDMGAERDLPERFPKYT